MLFRAVLPLLLERYYRPLVREPPRAVLPLRWSGTTARGTEVKFYFRSRRGTIVPSWRGTTAAGAAVKF